MGNYALREQLIASLGTELVNQLTIPAMPLTFDEYLDYLIDNAEGYIDGYLNKYYDVPICTDQSNGFCRRLTIAFAEYDIWFRAVGDDVPTKYKTAMEKAQATLDQIAKGELAPFSSNAGNSSIDIISDTRVMGEDELQYY